MAPQASQPPQLFSLNDLLRQHCHERLYVKPLNWTVQHLQLLGCRFVRHQRTPQLASSTQVNKQVSDLDNDLEDAVNELVDDIYVKTKKLECLYNRLFVISNDCISFLPYVF